MTDAGVRKIVRAQPGNIRKLERRDRVRIDEIVNAAGTFNDMEIRTALELVDEYLEKGASSGYCFAVIEEGRGQPRLDGYACYGPTPLTRGVYDLYWIVVAPNAQGRRLGRSLLEHVERDVVARGGRMLLIETSSQETYARTVDFYRANGYALEARVRDFYRIGDDKLIFRKDLFSKR